MSETERYSRYLELVALAEICFSMLASIGAAQGYNVVIGFFTVYSAYSRTGLAHLLSLLIDVVLCSLYGGGWSNAGRQYGFSLAMVIINMFVKSAALLCIWIIYNDLGGVISFPSPPSGSAGYHHFGPAHIDEDDFATSRHGRHDHHDREGAYQTGHHPVTSGPGSTPVSL